MALGAVSTPSKTWVPPVGMIITTGSSTSPAVLYEGTSWMQIKDRFLIGAGGSYSLGSTGGSTAHTLTVAEMPAHGHSATNISSAGAHTHTVTSVYGTGSISYWGDSGSTSFGTKTYTTNSAGSHSHEITLGSTGSGTSFSILNPYIAKYVWKRVY